MVKIKPQTIQIQGKGAGRLSEDLLIAEKFSYSVDIRKRKITLQRTSTPNGSSVKVWKANERNRIGYINMAKILRQVGIDWKDILGATLKVKRIEDRLVISL